MNIQWVFFATNAAVPYNMYMHMHHCYNTHGLALFYFQMLSDLQKTRIYIIHGGRWSSFKDLVMVPCYIIEYPDMKKTND